MADLEKLDRQTAHRIIEKLDFYLSTGNPLAYAKRLKNRDIGHYRFRIGDYRVIFDVDKKGDIVILIILAVRHRKYAYLD